jgi:hypothetical protein
VISHVTFVLTKMITLKDIFNNAAQVLKELGKTSWGKTIDTGELISLYVNNVGGLPPLSVKETKVLKSLHSLNKLTSSKNLEVYLLISEIFDEIELYQYVNAFNAPELVFIIAIGFINVFDKDNGITPLTTIRAATLNPFQLFIGTFFYNQVTMKLYLESFNSIQNMLNVFDNIGTYNKPLFNLSTTTHTEPHPYMISADNDKLHLHYVDRVVSLDS